jgi:DNA polymerase V
MPRYREGSRTGVGGRPVGEPTKVVRLPMTLAIMARKLAARTLLPADVNELLMQVEARRKMSIPLMNSYASCGFPSPADDYLDQPLDFNELLIQNPPATFAARVAGTSMIDVGIFPGDIVIINRALTPKHRSIVLALVDGEFTIKRYLVKAGKPTLKAENKEFPDVVIPESGFEIWGVIKNSIRNL